MPKTNEKEPKAGIISRRGFLANAAAGAATISLATTSSAQDDRDEPVVPPPKDAVTLFDGGRIAGWLSRKGGPAAWALKNGFMEVVPQSGDIYTERTFGDFQLHVEFWIPFMPEAKGQARANSGVYLQGLYEVQVLDSFGLKSSDDDCGAIYKVAAPLRNACKKPRTWQSYDIAFRAPRFDAGQLKEHARVTVFQNGFMIQDNLEIPGPTRRAMETDPVKPGPILLQEHHGDLVRFRNIWIIPV